MAEREAESFNPTSMVPLRTWLRLIAPARGLRRPYWGGLKQDRITSALTAIPRLLEWAVYGLPIARPPKKSTCIHGDRRGVQKATPNLARIPKIMRMFPGALYIHIVRNPYRLYPSYMHMLLTLTKAYAVQAYTPEVIEEEAVKTYRKVMRKYLQERSLIPDERFIEIRFEELRTDPLGQLERTYRHLGLNWETARSPIAEYNETLASYVQNRYAESPRVARQVDKHWGFAVAGWGCRP